MSGIIALGKFYLMFFSLAELQIEITEEEGFMIYTAAHCHGGSQDILSHLSGWPFFIYSLLC